MGERVTLADFEREIQSVNYPIDGERFWTEYENYVIELPGGDEPVGEILEHGAMNDEYTEAQAVLMDVYNNVSSNGVGRRNYTDRGGIEGMNERDSL